MTDPGLTPVIASIAPEDTFLRFSAPNPQQWDQSGRPTIAALSLKPGEDGLSGNLKSMLQSLGLDEASLIEGRPGYGLFGVSVHDITSAGCQVVHKPIVPPQRPEDPSHALIQKPDVNKPTWALIRGSILAAITVIVRPSMTL